MTNTLLFGIILTVIILLTLFVQNGEHLRRQKRKLFDRYRNYDI